MKRFNFKLLILIVAVFAFLVTPVIAGTPSTTKKNFWTARQVVKNGFTVDKMPLDIFLPMAAWALDGGDDIDENTAPDIGDTDDIPSITWDNSGETGAIQATFRLPGNSWTQPWSLVFYVLVASGTDIDEAGKLDWRIWVNRDGVVFDATAIEQDVVSASATGNLSTTHEVLTLTCNPTCIKALSDGDFITLDLFNATTHVSGSFVIKGAHGIFRARQKF